MKHLKHSFRALSLLILALVALLSIFLTSCEPKEDLVTTDPGAVLTASVDMVKFDTVFTSLGSITKRFWVYNRNAKAVKVDEIGLVGPGSSVARFELIIDGRPGSVRRDFELRGKDSLLVLVKVTIDPNASDTVFIVQDYSVQLRANGTTRHVLLQAYGENARYYTAPTGQAQVVACDETWTADRPIVLLGSALVDSSCTLTIAPGTRVYLANGASLVVRGRLRCGALDGPAVKFRGLRRDDFFDTTDPRYFEIADVPKYANTPGQWGTILFEPRRGSQRLLENEVLNTDIRNSTVGVFISNPYLLSGHQVRIEGCFIRNAYLVGVYGAAAGHGADGKVELINTVIARCGERAVLGVGGGTWRLAHCTIAMGVGLFNRRETEALAFNNALELTTGIRSYKTALTVENTILWSGLRDDEGKLQNELLLLREGGNLDSAYTLRHNVLQTRFTRFNTDGATYGRGEAGTNVLNEDPVFRDDTSVIKIDLRVDSLPSPARRLGEALVPAVPFDLRRTMRDGQRPSAGAYEAPL